MGAFENGDFDSKLGRVRFSESKIVENRLLRGYNLKDRGYN